MSTKLNLISMIKNTVETLPTNEAFLLDLQNTVSKLNPIRPRSTHYKPSSLHCMRMMERPKSKRADIQGRCQI